MAPNQKVSKVEHPLTLSVSSCPWGSPSGLEWCMSPRRTHSLDCSQSSSFHWWPWSTVVNSLNLAWFFLRVEPFLVLPFYQLVPCQWKALRWADSGAALLSQEAWFPCIGKYSSTGSTQKWHIVCLQYTPEIENTPNVLCYTLY